jgi:phosphodiesterase/alkaline phosphatase D-like protein
MFSRQRDYSSSRRLSQRAASARRFHPLVETLEDRLAPAASFLAVGSGDATSSDAILWTRAQDSASTQGVPLAAQVSTDQTFATGILAYAGTTVATQDYTIHIDATGLQSGTRYYFRFIATTDNTISPVGTFKTAPAPTADVGVRFGFTGDADGQMRPYDATGNFTAPGVPSFAQQNFDYFVWLGDTIYETASGSASTDNISPAVPDTSKAANLQASALPAVEQAYWMKYRQQLQPVSTGPYPGLQTFFSSTGHYTLLDNHELGNKQLINGGAPAGTPSGIGVDATNPANDVNTTGTYLNKTAVFQTIEQAYTDYQPIRVQTVTAPGDPRSDQTQKLYFEQQWGANTAFFNLDDRSYRDIRMKTPSGADDTGPRADNPGRTMLGQTQLQWFEQSLLAAQANGTTWKFVAVSSPIDQIGPVSGSFTITNQAGTYSNTESDGGKSWMGGYRSERNQLMKFIADNHIDHVVFLTTDDHQVRINELGYFTDSTDPTNSAAYQASYTRVPGAFQILVGPIGATGPDLVTDHSFANILSLANSFASQQKALGIDPIGLDPNFPGLQHVYREGDPNADTQRAPVDFYSPDTFNYAALDVSPDGRTLTVNVYGLNSYAVNTFPQPSANNPVRRLMSFQVVDIDRPGVFTNGSELDLAGSSSGDFALINPTGAKTDGSTGVQVTSLLGGVFQSQTYTQSFTAIHAYLGNGNDYFLMTPSLTIPAYVNAGNGNDFISTGAGDDVIQLGTGRDTVYAGGGNNMVTVAAGSTGGGTFQAGNGNNTFLLGNGNNTVHVGDGNNMIVVGGGTNFIQAGGGNNTIMAGTSMGTGLNTIMTGSGNNTVTVLGHGAAFIQTGAGQDVVVLGTSDFVYLDAGGGNDLIVNGLGPRLINLHLGDSIVVDGTALVQTGHTLRDILTEFVGNLAISHSMAAAISRSRLQLGMPNLSGLDYIFGLGDFDVLIQGP